MTASDQLLIPVPQACAMLGVGRTTLYALIAEGRLPSVQLGRRRLVPREALERFASSLSAA
jgi:excisionase family DNA binding protein